MKKNMMNNEGKKKIRKFSYPAFLICFLIVGLCLMFTFSYAIQTPSNNTTGGINTLEIVMSDGGKGTTITEMEPMTDDEGLNIINYKFTVTNQGPDKGTYQILIEDLINGEIEDGCSTKNLLLRSQLRYQLSLNNNQIALRNLDEVKMNVLDIQEIDNGESHNFSLRVWVPESASKTNWMKKHYHYKISIQQ